MVNQMRTVILVINQRTDTFSNVFLGTGLERCVEHFVLGGRRGESRNLREKGETFQKIGGKGQNTDTKKKSLANSLVWGNIWYMS